jgi:sulfate adenylyltransferase
LQDQKKFPVGNIPPHGGELVWLVKEGTEAQDLSKRATSFPKILLSHQEAYDLEMIATGAYSPLRGFMGQDDYQSVLSRKRLASGLPWPIPITLAVSPSRASKLPNGSEVFLTSPSGIFLGILRLEKKYPWEKRREAKEIFGTENPNHPGVATLFRREEMLLAGPVYIFQRQVPEFPLYRLDPRDTRALFVEKEWKRIVGFQTRNPIHRAHEYIIKCALEIVDGLFLNPLVGETKKDDIPAELRIKSYEAILKNYFPADRVVLAVLPVSMRYAGPREAIFHAIIRKNFGCTHFIVGRDHAGVGNYYGPFDAHRIFEEFDPPEIGIQPLFFDNAFYCYRCQSMATTKTCPHEEKDHLNLTGTKVRSMLISGEKPPPEFSRPEVVEVLREG